MAEGEAPMGADQLQVGDIVDVLTACRLPHEDVRHTGRVHRITQGADGTALYWIDGLAVARTADVLRRVHGTPLAQRLREALNVE